MATASVAASIAATLACVEEHGGDAVVTLHADGLDLGAIEGVEDLAVRLGRIARDRTPDDLIAQLVAVGFGAGRHYARVARIPADHHAT